MQRQVKLVRVDGKEDQNTESLSFCRRFGTAEKIKVPACIHAARGAIKRLSAAKCSVEKLLWLR